MIASIAARLVGQVPAFMLVGGAAQFEHAAQGLTTLPAAHAEPERR